MAGEELEQLDIAENPEFERSHEAWTEACVTYFDFRYYGTASWTDVLDARVEAEAASTVIEAPYAEVSRALTDLRLSPLERLKRMNEASDLVPEEFRTEDHDEHNASLGIDLYFQHGNVPMFMKAVDDYMTEYGGAKQISNFVVVSELDPEASGPAAFRLLMDRFVIGEDSEGDKYIFDKATRYCDMEVGEIENLATMAAYYGEDSLAKSFVELITSPEDLAELEKSYLGEMETRDMFPSPITDTINKIADEGSRRLLEILPESAYRDQLADYVGTLPEAA